MAQDIAQLWKEFRERQEAQTQKNLDSKAMVAHAVRWEERKKRWFSGGISDIFSEHFDYIRIAEYGMYGSKIEHMLNWFADGKPGPKDVDAK